jgi:uncharacterized protein YbcI
MLPTQGEIESRISEMINKFEQEYMGRGSTRIFSYLVAELVVIRLTNVLTVPEKQLVKNEVGASLLRGVRSHLVKMAMPHIQAIIQDITGTPMKHYFHDVDVGTAEELIVLVLDKVPGVREKKYHERPSGS